MRVTCMGLFTAGTLLLLLESPRFTISFWTVFMGTAQEPFAIGRRCFLLDWVTAWKYLASKFSVHDVKRYMFPNSGQSTLMARSSAQLSHITFWNTTPKLSSFLPRFTTTNPKSMASKLWESEGASTLTHQRATFATMKTPWPESTGRRSSPKSKPRTEGRTASQRWALTPMKRRARLKKHWTKTFLLKVLNPGKRISLLRQLAQTRRCSHPLWKKVSAKAKRKIRKRTRRGSSEQ